MAEHSRFTLEQEPDSVECWLVNCDGTFIGGIDRIGPDEFLSTHVAHGKPLSPVRVGPYKTLDAAFEAFTSVLA
jgi:hypothetical protein